ncbi:MAG: Do family serine endopeptidase [Alphaproteobacteria bacterium]|nr:Do family serine endopeptidase [Alphaproteobacteria bacterium]
MAVAVSACGGRSTTDAREPAPTAPDKAEAAPATMSAPQIESAPRAAPNSAAAVRMSFAPIVKKTAPAVVNVFTRSTVNRTTGDPFFDQFFNMGPREQQSLGSGVIVRPDGVIVTNNHVIQGAQEIKVVFSDRREFPAKVLLADPQSDLAVLKIDAGGPVPYLEFANSDALEVGDLVLAIGDPFGVGQTVTSGIVSALARTGVSVNDYQFFIQTDAAINPGNSGGALVDINGKLVGINSNIYSRSGGSNGIGFAIPSRLVQQVIRTALNGGKLTRPWLGASTEDVTQDIAKALGLDRPAGAIVGQIWEGGPASAAGLKSGDVITAIDDKPVYDSGAVRYRVGVHSAGDRIDVTYIRDGRAHQATVRLELPPSTPAPDPRHIDGNNPLEGVTVDNASPRSNAEAGIDPFRTGVVVTEVDPDSFAARRGLRRGFRILSVNGVKVKSSAELASLIERPARRWVLEIDTGDQVVRWQVGF